MNIKITREKTEAVCDSQINHMSIWITNYVIKNKTKFQTEGIAPIEIYNEYKITTRWPVGQKAFFPMLHLYGCEKIRKNNVFVYVIFE
jgi:hypothetical protein